MGNLSPYNNVVIIQTSVVMFYFSFCNIDQAFTVLIGMLFMVSTLNLRNSLGVDVNCHPILLMKTLRQGVLK